MISQSVKIAINIYYTDLWLDGFVNVDAKIFTRRGMNNHLIIKGWRRYERSHNVICENFLMEINIFQNWIESRRVHTVKGVISRSKDCEWSYINFTVFNFLICCIIERFKHLPGPERASAKPALTSESTNEVRPLFVKTVGMLPWKLNEIFIKDRLYSQWKIDLPVRTAAVYFWREWSGDHQKTPKKKQSREWLKQLWGTSSGRVVHTSLVDASFWSENVEISGFIWAPE
jgi:hypothetical protein